MNRDRDEMIGLADAAFRLRVPYQTAHRMVLLGKLAGTKEEGRWKVRLADLNRLLAERRSDGPGIEP